MSEIKGIIQMTPPKRKKDGLTETVRCVRCGRFMDQSSPNFTAYFTPDSDYSIEETFFEHKLCAKSAKRKG